MRWLSKHHITMGMGVLVALLIIFQRPLQDAVLLGHALETRYGLALLPGLAVLSVVLVGHLIVTRLERAANRRGDGQADRIVAMGHALARVSTMSALRNRLREHLPEVAGAKGVWAVIRVDKRWIAIAGGVPRHPHELQPEIEARADRMHERSSLKTDGGAGVEVDGHLCFPLTIGDAGFGVIGAPIPSVGAGQLRQGLASALAVVGVSVHNVQLLTQIDEHAMLDGLTGCFNQTQGMKVLDAELQRAKRVRSGVTLLILDLDSFKAINDQHGHLCGDAVLHAVGACLHQELRNSDLKIRYGGDEFIMLLPDTPTTGAAHVADILHQALRKVAVSWEGQEVSTTVSIGVATARSEEFDLSVDCAPATVRQSLIARADASLYRAKRGGRDRVCFDADPSEKTKEGTRESASPRLTRRVPKAIQALEGAGVEPVAVKS